MVTTGGSISKLTTIRSEYEIKILKRLIPKLMKKSWRKIEKQDQLLITLINLHTETIDEELDEQTKAQIDNAVERRKSDTIAYVAVNIIADIVNKRKREMEND